MRTKVPFLFGGVALAAMALFLLTPAKAGAGMLGVPCDNPQIFSGAAVNVVVLPYSTSLHRVLETNALGKQLSLLIQMHLLYDVLEYRNVGVVQLVNYESDASRCNSRDVWDRLNSRAGASGVVMVWGRIFQDEGEIYVQSFARFALQNMPESVVVSADGAKYSGILSAQEIAFPVRHVTTVELQQIADDYDRYATLRPAPGETRQGSRLSYGIGKCIGCDDVTLESNPRYSYVVLERRGDWALVKTVESGEQGWLRLGAPFQGRPLNEFLPELYLIKAMVGFLEARQEVIETNPTSLEKLVSRYTELAGQGTPEPHILGLELSGFEWLQTTPAHGNCTRAQTAFERALALDPSDADARNLAAISAICASFTDGLPLWESRIADEFLSATVVDRKQGPSLTNLRLFYEHANKVSAAADKSNFKVEQPLSADYVKGQLDRLSKVR